MSRLVVNRSGRIIKVPGTMNPRRPALVVKLEKEQALLVRMQQVMSQPLTVVTWLWNREESGLGPKHVHALRDMVAKGYGKPHRFVCVTDDPRGIECETYPLWDDYKDLKNVHDETLPSCYRRLKLFSEWAEGVFGVRRVSLDLDAVVTGNLQPLWDRPFPFIGWQVAGTYRERVYQGSMWLIQGEEYRDVWNRFNPEYCPKTAYAAGYGGTDQAWISWFIGERNYWDGLDGVLNWKTDLTPRMGTLPPSRIVFFPGDNGKPWDEKLRQEHDWVAEHYPW